MTMKNIKTKWVKRDIAYSLYVNDQETNVYFFPPTYKYFNFMTNGKENIRKAIATRKMIQSGELFAENGDWEGFDVCSSANFTMREICFFEPSYKYDYKNKILGVTMYRRPTEDEVKERHLNKTSRMQFITAIVNGRKSERVGCIIQDYGYSLFFY